MKQLKVIMMLIILTCLINIGNVSCEEALPEDTKLACEAKLCLSSNEEPTECEESLNRYFGIVRNTPKETKDARKGFLDQCSEE